METENLMVQIENCFFDSEIRERSFYPEFRRSWLPLIQEAYSNGEEYFNTDSPSVYSVASSFSGVDFVFHFDQMKIDEWYRKEQLRHRQVVFHPKRLHHGRDGLKFHKVVCNYDSSAPESALDENNRNIVAAAIPSLPPVIYIVYGNKWVDSRFNRFLNSRLSVNLLETDFVPAFLASSFEVCLYLFLMDCCIIKENFKKVKDKDLKQYLHIFRPSPMLTIKKIIP